MSGPRASLWSRGYNKKLDHKQQRFNSENSFDLEQQQKTQITLTNLVTIVFNFKSQMLYLKLTI